jgi:large subunit ribosomal protein L9
MKVILKEDVKSIGSMGQIIDVADGFARNYLVPRGFAVEANVKNVKSLEHEKKVIQEKAKKIKNQAVTTMDIAEQLKNEGIDIDRKKISLEEPIKRLGSYSVKVRVHPEISEEVNVQVVEE